MRVLIIMLTIMLGLFCHTAVFAIHPKAKVDVARCITEFSEQLKAQLGVRLFNISPDSLTFEQKAVLYRMFLRKEAFYVFAVCSEKSIPAINIKVYDSEGYLVIQNKNPGQRPLVSFQPKSTGPYTIKVFSEEGFGYFSLITMLKVVGLP
ncbi:hypothetical protein WDW89_18520 [Deltaproteobacteria bacterium TL4]